MKRQPTKTPQTVKPLDEYPGEWWTMPGENEDGTRAIFVTGRLDVETFRTNPRFKLRINVTLPYTATSSGIPDTQTAEQLKVITDRLVGVFAKDPVAVLTGIYTGDNRRDWVFYTVSINIFQRKFNEALDDLPALGFSLTAEDDPDWDEYAEMRSVLDQSM